MADDQRKPSDLKRAFAEDGAHKTSVGGQALIEGIMMRGSTHWSVAVRKPDGTIHTEEHELASGVKRGWRRWPLVRGCVALVESLGLGFRALEIAARHAFNEPVDESDPQSTHECKASDPRAPKASKKEKSEEFGKAEMTISLVLGVLLGVALFIVVPAFLANLIVGDYDTTALAWNLVDGIFRVAVFVFYVWLIGRMSDIKRMFAYHGAEHKAIHCYEHELELTPENARSFPCLHVRCGTAFLIMVMIIAIVVYSLVPLNPLLEHFGITNSVAMFFIVLAVRLAFLPVIAGISYEITVKWAGAHPENRLVRILLWPGMQMQRLTTNEPDDDQLECAIAAMKLVLAHEDEGDSR